MPTAAAPPAAAPAAADSPQEAEPADPQPPVAAPEPDEEPAEPGAGKQSPEPQANERRLTPPGPQASRRERVKYTRRVVEKIRRAAVADAGLRDAPDAFSPAGRTLYPEEQRTKQPLVLSAIVRPSDRSAFAVIEHEDAGFVGSYSAGNMLWPGVLPGVWVIDVRPGVVHLLDLESSSFEFLTFDKPLTPQERRAKERRERREAAKRRREARRRRR